MIFGDFATKTPLEKLDQNLESADPPPLSWDKNPIFSKNPICGLPLVNPTWQTSLKAIFFWGGLEGSTLPKGQIYIFCTLSALSLFQIATPLTGVSILRFQSDTDISQLCISLSI